VSVDIKLVRDIAEAAGRELLQRFRRKITVQTKVDDSLVTEADLASQDLICRQIRESFPDDEILAEEGPQSVDLGPSSRALWLIDPLDGTTNFAHGFDYFCVSIARATWDPTLKSWRPDLGVVHVPTQGLTYWSVKGGGAWLNDQPLSPFSARPVKAFSRCFLVTGFAYDQGSDLRTSVDRFLRVASQCNSIRRPGAAALDLCQVASGVFDAYWENGVKPWDVAAGLCLLYELGAKVVDYKNAPYRLGGGDAIVGQPGVVDTIAKLF
jgi:myo-inositol-1(or 4)-monophosphatase